jgi:hypothetical protein
LTCAQWSAAGQFARATFAEFDLMERKVGTSGTVGTKIRSGHFRRYGTGSRPMAFLVGGTGHFLSRFPRPVQASESQNLNELGGNLNPVRTRSPDIESGHGTRPDGTSGHGTGTAGRDSGTGTAGLDTVKLTVGWCACGRRPWHTLHRDGTRTVGRDPGTGTANRGRNIRPHPGPLPADWERVKEWDGTRGTRSRYGGPTRIECVGRPKLR